MQDAAHKLIYSHPRMVADLLRGFLPEGEAAGFDFDTLEPMPASRVGRRLERREGDLMWRLRSRAAPTDGWVHVLVLLEFQSGVDRSMALRVLTYTGLAWEGLLRSGTISGKRPGNMARSREEARSGGESSSVDGAKPRRVVRPRTPLPPVIPFVVYNGSPTWTAPEDVSDLVAPAPPPLARLQPRNRYVLLDIQRTDTGGVPEDNLVGLQMAVARAMPEDKPAILSRMGAVLSGAEHGELREAFMEWVKWSWAEDYRRLGGEDDGLLDELGRLVTTGEVETMSSLMVKKWEERERQKEAQILARGMKQGRTEGIEFMLERQATRRFNAFTGERLSALLAGVSEPDRLTAVGDAVIECGTGEELLAAARRIVGDGAE